MAWAWVAADGLSDRKPLRIWQGHTRPNGFLVVLDAVENSVHLGTLQARSDAHELQLHALRAWQFSLVLRGRTIGFIGVAIGSTHYASWEHIAARLGLGAWCILIVEVVALALVELAQVFEELRIGHIVARLEALDLVGGEVGFLGGLRLAEAEEVTSGARLVGGKRQFGKIDHC